MCEYIDIKFYCVCNFKINKKLIDIDIMNARTLWNMVPPIFFIFCTYFFPKRVIRLCYVMSLFIILFNIIYTLKWCVIVKEESIRFAMWGSHHRWYIQFNERVRVVYIFNKWIMGIITCSIYWFFQIFFPEMKLLRINNIYAFILTGEE